MTFKLIFFLLFPATICFGNWELAPFFRIDELNPIIKPDDKSIFYCPIQNKIIHWESKHTFNPAAIVKNDLVYLFYRAEDDYGDGIGKHTSRIGLAVSADGIHFHRNKLPLIFPTYDEQFDNEFPGGCEDPRIVEADDGTYVMTYTQWNGQIALLGIATSKNLIHWKKHGYIFEGNEERQWSKSGSIVCRQENERLIATKINGKYWMYWGEGNIYIATSDNLISWHPLRNDDHTLQIAFGPREGKFDSELVEPGPPAIITKNGILFLYNGKNGSTNGDTKIISGAYSAGQALFDINDPTKLINRCDNYFLAPEKSYEINGQYSQGTIFIEGLIYFKNRWIIYYGTADSAIGVAISPN